MRVGGGERIRFTSAILPLWARRTMSLDALLPVLYLRGISTGDFQEALAALLGQNAPNLSPAVISRLTAEWQGEYERWQKRDLAWMDGIQGVDGWRSTAPQVEIAEQCARGGRSSGTAVPCLSAP